VLLKPKKTQGRAEFFISNLELIDRILTRGDPEDTRRCRVQWGPAAKKNEFAGGGFFLIRRRTAGKFIAKTGGWWFRGWCVRHRTEQPSWEYQKEWVFCKGELRSGKTNAGTKKTAWGKLKAKHRQQSVKLVTNFSGVTKY